MFSIIITLLIWVIKNIERDKSHKFLRIVENVMDYLTRNKKLILIFLSSHHMTLCKLQISLGLSFCKMRDLNYSLRDRGENQSAVNIQNLHEIECLFGHFF